ncbi:hypothetical protein Taro_025328 [Colocasia esculenta]|uniref:Uncharacterized protein n=1 Tax=Colocasia esculenta TaxID=4460 RepID=A0A843V964_COLES|nr:hypothetical protein [Colocasia esculenta]
MLAPSPIRSIRAAAAGDRRSSHRARRRPGFSSSGDPSSVEISCTAPCGGGFFVARTRTGFL